MVKATQRLNPDLTLLQAVQQYLVRLTALLRYLALRVIPASPLVVSDEMPPELLDHCYQAGRPRGEALKVVAAFMWIVPELL